MGQRKRTRDKQEADYEQDLEWLVEETARLKFDLARLVLAVPRAVIRLARGETESRADEEGRNHKGTKATKRHKGA